MNKFILPAIFTLTTTSHVFANIEYDPKPYVGLDYSYVKNNIELVNDTSIKMFLLGG